MDNTNKPIATEPAAAAPQVSQPEAAVLQTPTPPPPLSKSAIPALEHKSADTALAICTLMASFLFWRWGVWGGFRLGFAVTYGLFFAMITAFAGQHAKRALHWNQLLCGGTALGLAAGFALYDDPLFHFILFAAIVCLTAWYLLGLYQSMHYDSGDISTFLDVARVVFLLPFRHIAVGVKTLFGAKEGKRSMGKVLIGVVAAVPLLVLVGALLASGDEAFHNALTRLAESLGEIAWQLVLAAAFFFPLYSLLFSVHRGLEQEARGKKQEAGKKGLDLTAAVSFLSALSLLYLGYLFTQLAYFFSGFKGLLPEGFSEAQYARRGFFELCAVAALNLLVILVVFALSRRGEAAEQRQPAERRLDKKLPLPLRAVSAFICLFTLVLIATAESKMALYVEQLGMTRLRLQVSLFILLLAFAFLLLLVWIFARRFGYMKLMLAAACALLLCMNYADVDRTVLRYNIWAWETGRLETLDVGAFRELGEAKVPYLIELSKSEDPAVRAQTVSQLYAWLSPYYIGLPEGGQSLLLFQSEVDLRTYMDQPGWAGWNRTREKAVDAMDAYLNSGECPLRESWCDYCRCPVTALQYHQPGCGERLREYERSGLYYCHQCGEYIASPTDHDPYCPGHPENDMHGAWCGACLTYAPRRKDHQTWCSERYTGR